MDSVLELVPLSSRYLLLFLKSTEVLFYDVHQAKVIDCIRLKAMVCKAKVLADDELVCSLTNGELLLIKMEKDKTLHVSVLSEKPLGSDSPNRIDANNNSVLIDFLVLKHDGSFLAKQTGSSSTMLYYFKREDSKISKEYLRCATKQAENLFQVVNDRGLVAAFCQYPDASGRWTVNFYDQQNLFKEEVHIIDGGPIFKDKVVVQFIR